MITNITSWSNINDMFSDIFSQVFLWNLMSFIPLLLVFVIMIILIKIFQDKIVQKINSFFNKIFKRNEHILTEEIREIMSSVNSDLSELRAEMYADRAYIYHFHNGLQFTSKYPSWKLSNTFLKVKPSVSSRFFRFQNLEVSLFWDDFIKVLWYKKEDEMPPGIYVINNNNICLPASCIFPRKVLLINVNELNYSGQIRIELEEMGVYCFLITPILDASKEHIIGYIGIDYNDKETFEEIYNEKGFTFCKLCQFALHLSTYFTLNTIPEIKFVEITKKLNIQP